MSILFKWRNELSFISMCTSRNQLHSIEAFDKELSFDFQKDRHLQFLICLNQIPIGTIFTYSYNEIDKYAFVSVFIEDRYANKSYGIKAFLILCKQLFEQFKLYKVYIDIYDYNGKMLSVMTKCKFSLEGVFKDQHLYNNKRYDVRRYALYEKDILFWFNKLLNTCKQP